MGENNDGVAMATQPTSGASAGWRQTRAIVRTIVVILASVGTVALLFALRGIVLLIVLAIFFAYLVAPIVERVHAPISLAGRRRRVPRALAIVLVYLVLFGGAAASLYSLVPRVGDQVTALAKAAPTYVTQQRERMQSLNSWYRRSHLPPSVRTAIDNAGARGLTLLAQRGEELSAELMASLRFIPWLLLIPVIAFFLLKDAGSFRRSALLALPPGRVRWRGADLLTEINSTLAFFIRAQLLACVFVGAVCTIGFVALGVPYGLVLGAAATVLEMFPFVGPVMTLVVAVLFASTKSIGLAVAVLLFLGVLRLIHDYLVYPRLIARAIKLHPLAIILAVLCGSTLGGYLGLFLAIPVTAVLFICYRYLRLHLGGEGLVSELIEREMPPDLPAVASDAYVDHSAGKLFGVRVLVVDNDADAREVLIDVLEREGSEVFGADSAAEGLTLARALKPHVIVSDLAMPGEDGFDLIRKLRDLTVDRGGGIPAVALSGYASDEDRTRALHAGFQRHLSKPVDPNHLARVIVSLASQGT